VRLREETSRPVEITGERNILGETVMSDMNVRPPKEEEESLEASLLRRARGKTGPREEGEE
jgi:hypothetical protein